MPMNRLREYLDEHGTEYVIVSHSKAYTAQKIAASAHISGHQVAKSVILNVDGKMIMVVVPASHRVNMNRLKRMLGAESVDLAREPKFQRLFPDCEVGAMPPFGNLYNLDVYVDRSLTEDDVIAFNACSHNELVRMAYKDFEKLVNPHIIDCTFEHV